MYEKGLKYHVFLQKKKTTGKVVFFKYRPCMRVGPVFCSGEYRIRTDDLLHAMQAL